ncbi:interferon regulatory factor 9 [Trematomus bernacchii]|uniref:interferon regulatory factor 9 n=1 Tax=Trematomus bernacchii TaxID=40690 RepID=UPI00146A36FF|nr:interferon regulatory factor 9 [Trematomus bernacchii]
MAGARTRSTRRLRSWIVEQVSSDKFPGLMWDDDAKTMFRIPWKHAGKQDFRKDEDAAIFKAWAVFKGKLRDGSQDNPASWKTRLRCALNKSTEFMEVMERAQLDISEPYKVYRLVPVSEQNVMVPEKKCRAKVAKKSKRRSRSSSDDDSESSDASQVKQIKEEEVTSQLCVEEYLPTVRPAETEEPAQHITSSTTHRDVVDEFTLDVRFEESISAPVGDEDSFGVVVQYLGQEVLKRHIQRNDIRILYLPPSSFPPAPAVLKGRFPRVPLPEPPPSLPAGPELQALLTLLPFMERGVVLTSTLGGVYGKRLCRGRVFWTGPHCSTPGLHKMERNTEPVMLFCKETFKQQLHNSRMNGGDPPQCGITLCFGEELCNTEDPSSKLIIVQISFPWAEQQVQNTQAFFESLSMLHSLASQSPLGEITLNLVTVSPSDPDVFSCGTA